jgi:glycosyltransferase involved in cell wall biosynthesis
MRMTMICCPFKTSYGSYASCLKTELEKKTGGAMQWVASNCGCGDPIETSRQFQTQQCDYFENPPIIGDFRSKQAWKRKVRSVARNAVLYMRARKYASLSKNAEIVHFQQILNAYGSKAVFHWLRQPSNAVRVITVHELDAEQLESPESNRTYNLADAIIVHCEDLKKHMVALKVPQEKIHVVLHGVSIPEPAQDKDAVRQGIIFYGGHKLMTGKGIQNLFQAMKMLKEQMGAAAPTLRIHGHYGTTVPEAAQKLAEQMGIADKVIWLNQITVDEIVHHYQRALVCVLPFTGSFAGLPGSLAAACQLPIVCTRKAGLPDHLGDTPVWIDEENPQQLAARLTELLASETLRREVAGRQLKRAEEFLRWDVIADRTLQVYEAAARSKAASGWKPSTKIPAAPTPKTPKSEEPELVQIGR